jgi:hypothetical protein
VNWFELVCKKLIVVHSSDFIHFKGSVQVREKLCDLVQFLVYCLVQLKTLVCLLYFFITAIIVADVDFIEWL